MKVKTMIKVPKTFILLFQGRSFCEIQNQIKFIHKLDSDFV